MHPYDVKRNINWAVHLVGRILVVGWALGLVAGVLVIFTDQSSTFALLGLWPLGVGLWLLFADAPEPVFLPDEDEYHEGPGPNPA